MKAIFPSASKASTTSPIKSAAERRLDAAFAAFVERKSQERGGWTPTWTTNLKAEMWAQFAHESRELMKVSGVPPMERAWDLEKLNDRLPASYLKVARRLLRMIDEPVTLAINGERGTGKSTMAWGLVMKFCNLCRPAVYRTATEMFNELSDAPWAEKQAMRERKARPDLLVLDEVQVRDSGKEWQDNELTTLIDRRYREHKATLLLSNMLSQEMRSNLGDSIWRRLIETGGQPLPTPWGRIKEVLAGKAGAA